MQSLYPIPVKTKWGTFKLEISPKGLYAVKFPGSFLPRRDPVSTKRDRFSIKATQAVNQYFNDPARKINFKLDLSGRTIFEKKIYRALQKVPAGQVISYGELARRTGYPGAARAVGSAMRKNRLPIVIPCHRVIPATGGIGKYSAGKQWKRRLLEYEKKGLVLRD